MCFSSASLWAFAVFFIMSLHSNEMKLKVQTFVLNWKDNFRITREEALNIEATKKMGVLHDALKNAGYVGHAFEVYLVRLLFFVC